MLRFQPRPTRPGDPSRTKEGFKAMLGPQILCCREAGGYGLLGWLVSA